MPSLIIKTGGIIMSEKYMKIKRIIIPTITMVVIASQLFGCSSATKQETYNMLQDSTEIELEYAELDTVDNKEISSLDWIELGNLTTYSDLRASWDKIVGVTGTTGNKTGMLYKNWEGPTQDNYLAEVILSTEFVDFVSNEDNYNKLVDAVRENFTDSDDLTDEQLFSIGLNAYFSLLPMEDEAESYANDYITRAQFLALITRATNPVSVQESDDYKAYLSQLETTAGESIYNQAVAFSLPYSYLLTEDGSLNSKTYDSAISRGEAIYTIINMLYGEEGLATVNIDESSNAFTDTRNGGDILTEQGLKSKAEEISYAIQNPDKGCPEDIYKTLVKAQELGLIGSETAWDEAITLSDAITLYYNTALSKLETTDNSASTDGNANSSTSKENDSVPESKGWSDYKKTVEYYKEQGLMSDKAAYVLNPDIYGTETAGKGAGEIASGNSACVDAAVQLKRLVVTTTKGYPIEAWYYVEAGTVQFIYTGEMNPGGGWYTDPDGGRVLDKYFNFEKSALDITHEQKIEILGEPTMTAEEVIAALQ